MKKAAHSLSLILVVTLLLWGVRLPVYADSETPEQYNQRVVEKIAVLQEKYFISITYPATTGYAPIGTATLATLDAALETVTPAIVRQVSQHYYNQNGQRLRFAFTFSDQLSGGKIDPILAGFDDKRSLIEVYIPAPGASAIVTGCSPTALVHEFAHALHLMCEQLYGSARMQAEWTALNLGLSYHSSFISDNPNEAVFATGYAATNYNEDVAETFACAFVYSRNGLGLGSRLTGADGSPSALARKIQYLAQLLPLCLTDTHGALENMQRAFYAGTHISYKEARLSGSYLEYMGYNQPNRVLEAMMEALYLNMETCAVDWVVEIGGWNVVDPVGNEYILFPGGTWGQLVRVTTDAA